MPSHHISKELRKAWLRQHPGKFDPWSDLMLKLIIFLVMLYLTYRAIRYVLKESYFRGEEFAAHRTEIAAFVDEHMR
jgi:hypothetical protein